MIVFESSQLFKWLLLLLIPLFIVILFGLFCWYRYRKRKKLNKEIPRIKPIGHLPSPRDNSTKRTVSNSCSQFTNADKAYLDKLVRTASDRSMLKRNFSKKLRKVPSGLIKEKN